MFVFRFSVHLLGIDDGDRTTPQHWCRLSTRTWSGIPRQGELVSLDDRDTLLRPLAMASYRTELVDLEFREGLTPRDIPMLRRLGFRPAETFVGDEPFGPDLPATNVRHQLLAECLKRLVRGDNRDEPDERCWGAFTGTLGLDPDRQDPYTSAEFDRPTYAMLVDVFAELSGLAEHHEAHDWPTDGETLVAVEAVAAFHRAISEPDIPREEREQAHVEALVQCLRQWVTDIPLGLQAAVRDLEAPAPSAYEDCP